jgi:Family of unknown function (DUF6880)
MSGQPLSTDPKARAIRMQRASKWRRSALHPGARAVSDKRIFRCFSHSLGMGSVSSSSCTPFGCLPLRIASTMSGVSSVSRSSRLTKLRVTPSASASSPAERHLRSSSNRFHRCSRASARISVSSGRGFSHAGASSSAACAPSPCAYLERARRHGERGRSTRSRRRPPGRAGGARLPDDVARLATGGRASSGEARRHRRQLLVDADAGSRTAGEQGAAGGVPALSPDDRLHPRSPALATLRPHLDHLLSCAGLAPLITDWQGHQPHAEYAAGLRQRHPRKSSFWSRVDVPAKK